MFQACLQSDTRLAISLHIPTNNYSISDVQKAINMGSMCCVYERENMFYYLIPITIILIGLIGN